MKKVLKSMLALAIATFTFTSCEDVPEPYGIPSAGGSGETEVIEPAGSGTLEDPYNVAAALEYVNSLAADVESDNDVYIKGKVVTVNTNFDESGTFGNAVFYISDDGTNKTQFYVYRTLYLGNKKYTSGTLLNEGDEVIICGKVVNYKGTTPETVQSKSYVYSLNGVTAGGGGGETPTTVIEISCAKAVELTNALENNATSAETYAVTGYITEVVGSVSKNQQTFWMADTKDGGRVFEAYWADLPDGVSEFKAGSKVKITGNLMKYVKNGNVTPEIKNAKVEILEAADEGGGTGGGGETGGETTKNVNSETLVVTFTNSGTAGTSTTYDLTTCGLAHQTENPSFTLNGVTFTFAVADGSTTPKYWKTGSFDEFRMYAKNTLKISAASNIVSVAFQCVKNGANPATGNDQAYGTISGKDFTFVNEWTGSSGGTQFRFTSVTITYAK